MDKSPGRIRVIPTPRKTRRLPGCPKVFERGAGMRIILSGGGETAGHASEVLRKAAEGYGITPADILPAGAARQAAGFNDILLFHRGGSGAAKVLPRRAAESEALLGEEGYVIHSGARSPVVLCGGSEKGLLHAVYTLLQLLSPHDSGALLENILIEDYPEFRIRANNWNLFAETGGASYDRGDGREEYEKRILRKLDMLAAYKINVAYIDGIGWNPERFPGYGAMMRRLNRAARIRGVKLGFTGFGSGYGARPLHVSPVFENRESYPGGKVYRCCGLEHGKRAREMGTCLSNPGLTELKLENLAEFVKAVEPGLLYIHNLDVSRMKNCSEAWMMRCARCREMWPDDDIQSPRGMAGAFADFYNKIASAVNSVENPSSGFKASRDTVIRMVSPNYTSRSEPDSEWKFHLDYFRVIARRIEHSNVHLGIREQFLNHGGGRRCPQMAEAFRDSRASVSLLHFFGGDMFYNNTPFTPVPVVNAMFSGVDGIFNGNGNGYQEPQQLFNAECMWNPSGSAFFRVKAPRSYGAFAEWYWALRSGECRPEGVFSPGGFLDAACDKLYGKKAGKYAAEIYRMRGEVKLDRLRRHFAFTSPLLPSWNKLMPVLPFSDFMLEGIEWKKELSEKQRGAVGLMIKAFGETERLQKRAVNLSARAVKAFSGDEGTLRDLEWLNTTLSDGMLLIGHMREYLGLLRLLHPVFGGKFDRGEAERRLNLFGSGLDGTRADFARRYRGASVGPFGGDPEHRRKVADWLISEQKKMLRTLKTGRWPERNRVLEWW